MADLRFSSPIPVALPQPASEPRVVQIDNPRDAIMALNRHGVGGFHIENPLWQTTSDRLARAMRDPTPESMEEARRAFAHLVHELS